MNALNAVPHSVCMYILLDTWQYKYILTDWLINECAALLILKVLFRIHQSFCSLDSISYSSFAWDINYDLIGWKCLGDWQPRTIYKVYTKGARVYSAKVTDWLKCLGDWQPRTIYKVYTKGASVYSAKVTDWLKCLGDWQPRTIYKVYTKGTSVYAA